MNYYSTPDYVKLAIDFGKAIAEPDVFCISGRCRDTNWGGKDRLHFRDSNCPEYSYQEISGYLAKCESGMNSL